MRGLQTAPKSLTETTGVGAERVVEKYGSSPLAFVAHGYIRAPKGWGRMVHASAGGRLQHRHQLPHLRHGLIAFPRRVLPWIEPWFFVYACLGVVQDGVLPLLLPLSAGGSSHAGAIVGVMNLAGLTSPFWGHFADRRRLHRQVLVAGMLVVTLALLLMPAHLGLPLQLAIAGILGIGFAAANTVANIFIIGVRPQEEWDARIGALQLLIGLGEVVGLLLAGIIGGRYALAFGVSAAGRLRSARCTDDAARRSGAGFACRGRGALAGWRSKLRRLAAAAFSFADLVGIPELATRIRDALRKAVDRLVCVVRCDERGPNDVSRWR